MNNDRLKKLFNTARSETPPAAPADFDAAVMRAIRRDVPASRVDISISDQLSLWFPKVAWTAVALICVCVAGEIVSSAHSPNLGDGIAEVSDQWLFTEKGF